MKERCCICCDLKSYYASVECVERGLDPMTTNLVVADQRRTEKTICLAVSPSLKAYGISGRARLFEVVQRVAEVNARRKQNAPGRQLTGASWHDPEVRQNPSLALDYIVAPPRMAHYIDWSTRVYRVYLKYIAPEDIYPYSIDEVFLDVTHYLDTYKMTARELTRTILLDILETTGITAAAGMGTNLYLAKVAMDIQAKHVPADEYGVRIAELDEMSYRRALWTHRPLTDFWRVGKGYAAKLEAHGLYTMGDIARCSLGKSTDYHNEELLYKLFGVNAEILIDHAWGIETCGMEQIKAYKPATKSLASGQVLPRAYSWEEGRLAVKEMTEQVVLGLVEQGYVAEGVTLYVGYQILSRESASAYHGPLKVNYYGRKVPPSVHGTGKLGAPTASLSRITQAVLQLYDRLVDKELQVRRMSIAAIRLCRKEEVAPQLSFYADQQDDGRETALLEATIGLHRRYGKNAVVKGMDLLEAGTTRERNNQIGGHRK